MGTYNLKTLPHRLSLTRIFEFSWSRPFELASKLRGSKELCFRLDFQKNCFHRLLHRRIRHGFDFYYLTVILILKGYQPFLNNDFIINYKPD